VTPPRSVISRTLETPWFRSSLTRRLTFLVLALILAVLSFFPQHYVAEAELMPQESGGGLSAVLAQQASGAILDLGALVGNKTSVEADLTIARSHDVAQSVLDRLQLVGKPGFGDNRQAEAKLAKKVDVVAVRGSLLQIRVSDADPDFAKTLTAAVAQSIRDRLAQISLEQAAEKRSVATNRLADAAARLAKAQAALTQFRVANNLPAPEAQLGSGVNVVAGLQADLQTKQTQLAALRQVATDNNVQVRLLQAEIGGIQKAIAAATANSPKNPLNLQGVAQSTQRYYDLYREYQTDEILFQVYSRYLDELVIDELSAQQNMNVVEPAFIEPTRQLNFWAVGLLCFVILSALGAEYYLLVTPKPNN